jgi:hypothetical protein
MRIDRIHKFVSIAALGGCLFGQVNCLPTRTQLYSTFNGGIMNGIQLALTLAITEFLTPGVTDTAEAITDTTDTTDTTQ